MDHPVSLDLSEDRKFLILPRGRADGASAGGLGISVDGLGTL